MRLCIPNIVGVAACNLCKEANERGGAMETSGLDCIAGRIDRTSSPSDKCSCTAHAPVHHEGRGTDAGLQPNQRIEAREALSARWSWFAIAALQLPEGGAPAHERPINVRTGMEAMEHELHRPSSGASLGYEASQRQ